MESIDAWIAPQEKVELKAHLVMIHALCVLKERSVLAAEVCVTLAP
jgi:hypothetical protein